MNLPPRLSLLRDRLRQEWDVRWNALGEPRRRVARTAALVAAALLCLWVLWWHYMLAPWTRDGRVRAEVVKVAPEVSGTVAEVRVEENQYLHKGDVLFVIDPVRFRLALAQAEAVVSQREADFRAKDFQAKRRADLLKANAVSIDEQQQFQGVSDTAQAALAEAAADRDVARLNLERSVVRSPVDGYPTNFTLRVGDFANAGQVQLSLVDADSFYVLGYFEETKLRRIRDRAPATVRLMQGGPAISGHVESVSAGIADLNAADGAEGLASVDPVFTWVRLAQRLPVRIHLDRVPPRVRLATGLTCTVTVSEWRRPVPLPPPIVETPAP